MTDGRHPGTGRRRFGFSNVDSRTRGVRPSLAPGGSRTGMDRTGPKQMALKAPDAPLSPRTRIGVCLGARRLETPTQGRTAALRDMLGNVNVINST